MGNSAAARLFYERAADAYLTHPAGLAKGAMAAGTLEAEELWRGWARIQPDHHAGSAARSALNSRR
jgi:hypothetical protein